MADYRLFCHNDDGRIVRREDFEADDDPQAIERARELCDGAPAELWSGKRLVGKLPRTRS